MKLFSRSLPTFFFPPFNFIYLRLIIQDNVIRFFFIKNYKNIFFWRLQQKIFLRFVAHVFMGKFSKLNKFEKIKTLSAPAVERRSRCLRLLIYISKLFNAIVPIYFWFLSLLMAFVQFPSRSLSSFTFHYICRA